MELIATCPDELKDVLCSEIEALGGTNLKQLYRAVAFEADERTFYEAHLKLRTPSRILKVIKEVPAKSPEMLFSQARRIQWPDLFDIERTFVVEGVPAERGPDKMTANAISQRVREGLQDAFWRRHGRVPKVDLKEPKVVIVAHILNGVCTLSFDTSGKSLHKRGYRDDGHPAPIKETLAAALLHLAGYDGSQPLYDPMCGSGTIAIEAAMIALNKAPQIHRKKGQFLFEWLTDFNKDRWRAVQEDARELREKAPRAPIYAADLSDRYVKLARANALRARVEKDINFTVGAIEAASPPTPHGILIANLPYGARLGKEDPALATLYKTIGDVLKHRFAGWQAALLVADDAPWRSIGLRPKRRIPVHNGAISCRLLLFEMYEGSRRTPRQATDFSKPPEAPAALH